MTQLNRTNPQKISVLNSYTQICSRNFQCIATRIILLLVLLLMVYATTNAQSKEGVKQAIQNAENISNLLYLDSDAQLEQQSYLIPIDEILVVDKDGLSFNARKTAMIPPGTYTFGVRYKSYTTMKSAGPQVSSGNFSMGMSYSQTLPVYSKIIDADVTFEPGKCYTFKYERNKDKSTKKDKRRLVSLVEVDDNDLLANLEKDHVAVNDYLEWSRANPDVLKGTYKKGKTEITFTGNRVNFISYIFGMKYDYNGIFWYNENTIIVYTDSLQTGKQPRSAHDRATVWYYDVNSCTISLSGSIAEDSFSINVTGVYTDGSVVLDGKTPRNIVASLPEAPDILWQIEGQTLTVSGEGDIPANPSWVKAIANIDSVIIEDNITSLGSRAFAMSKLSSIVIGAAVTSLKSYALFNCNNLTQVEVKSAVPPKIGSFVFMSTPISKAKLIVPAGSKAAYKNSKDWKRFGTIEER